MTASPPRDITVEDLLKIIGDKEVQLARLNGHIQTLTAIPHCQRHLKTSKRKRPDEQAIRTAQSRGTGAACGGLEGEPPECAES